jgi:tetratricopeptide (TPR) repeat protein
MAREPRGVKEDATFTKEKILELPLSESLIHSASAIFLWKDRDDFLHLEKYLRSAYASLPEADRRNELERREGLKAGVRNGIALIDTGILALTLAETEEARESFETAAKDPEVGPNASLQFLIARSQLEEGGVEEALATYRTAEEAASSQTSILFSIRFHFTQALLFANRLEEAEAIWLESSFSSDPLLRAWSLEELLYVTWYTGSAQEHAAYLAELKDLEPRLVALPDSRFQQNRLERVRFSLDRFTRAAQGDRVAAMGLDSEAVETGFKMNDLAGVLRTLEPWIEQYPMSGYSSWPFSDFFARRDMVDCHLDYYAALCLEGNPPGAEEGFRRIVAHLPEGDMDDRLIDAHCWVGYTLLSQNRLVEAKQEYEKGFALDYETAVAKGRGGEYLQPVLGGAASDRLRPTYIDNYRHLLRAIEEQPGKGEKN